MHKRQEVFNAVEKRLSPSLFRHVCQVAEVAQKMAAQYKENQEKAYLAGILHDYAKEKPGTELLKIAGENDLLDDAVFRQAPYLLHAPVGALLVKRELGIDDEEIINAISNHTLGRPSMSKLEKIIFLADMIEPERHFPAVAQLRKLAENDLDRAMLAGLDYILRHCLDQNRLIHPRTVLARNYFLLLPGT